MPLDPLPYLPLARAAARALARRFPHLDRDDAHAEATLALVDLAHKYDPARCPDPRKYLAVSLRRRLIDWLRRTPRTPQPRPAPAPAEPWHALQSDDFRAHLRHLVGEADWPLVLTVLEGRTLAWAGAQLGVGESRASQRRTALFARLRTEPLRSFLKDQLP